MKKIILILLAFFAVNIIFSQSDVYKNTQTPYERAQLENYYFHEDPCPPCPCIEKKTQKKMYSPNKSAQTVPPVVVNVYNSGGNNCCCNPSQVAPMQQYYQPLNWYDNSGYWCFLLGTLLLGGLLGYMLGERNRNSGIGKESEKH